MKGRILVVDDHPMNLKLASDLMQIEGYTVDRAEDAEQAMEAIRRAQPDLILMDVALPGVDGLSLTQEIKADPATRHIPIVALTAFAMKGDEERVRAAGCDGYIAKPIDTRKLPSQVEKMLARARGR
jgi:two-component system cell cycle response regulator